MRCIFRFKDDDINYTSKLSFLLFFNGSRSFLLGIQRSSCQKWVEFSTSGGPYKIYHMKPVVDSLAGGNDTAK